MRTSALVYSLLALFSTALVAGAAAVIWIDYRASLGRVERGAVAAAEAYAAHAARDVEELRLGVAWLSRKIDPRAPDYGIDSAAGDVARMIVSQLPAISALFVVGADGRVKFSTAEAAASDVDVSDRDYFNAARRGLPEFVGPAISAGDTGDVVYTLSKRLEENGRFAGIAVASALIERWNEILEPMVPVPMTLLGLLRPDGRAVVALRTRPEGISLETVMSAGSAGSLPAATDFIVVRMPVHGSELTAQVAVPRAAALALWAARRNRVAAGAALGLAALSILGALGRQMMHREAAALATAATRAKELEARTDELHRALETQRLLMAELQHRVRNSLALAAGMLDMQKARARDGAMRDALEIARARILAIAKVHDRLLQSGSPSVVRLDSYFSGLCGDVAANLDVACVVDADPVAIPSEQAVSLGLIVTELLLNAAKHAGSGPDMRIEVSAKARADALLLSVRDHGRGLPAGFEISDSAGLGMRIISSLLAELGGQIEVQNADPGVRFLVRVPSAERSEAS